MQLLYLKNSKRNLVFVDIYPDKMVQKFGKMVHKNGDICQYLCIG
jgi:hypothetical protein